MVLYLNMAQVIRFLFFSPTQIKPKTLELQDRNTLVKRWSHAFSSWRLISGVSSDSVHLGNIIKIYNKLKSMIARPPTLKVPKILLKSMGLTKDYSLAIIAHFLKGKFHPKTNANYPKTVHIELSNDTSFISIGWSSAKLWPEVLSHLPAMEVKQWQSQTTGHDGHERAVQLCMWCLVCATLHW